MGQISMEIFSQPGSALSGNQQLECRVVEGTFDRGIVLARRFQAARINRDFPARNRGERQIRAGVDEGVPGGG